MPDTPVDPHSGDPYHSGMEARVSVLEEIVVRIDRRLDDLAAEMRGLRSEMNSLRSDQRTDFRWLLGTILGLSGAAFVLMAHGFHWLP